MRKKIGRKIYDTEKSKEVGKQTVSYFGDSHGFEEIMFEKAKDDYFLLVKGGPASQYPEEDIIPLSLEDAKNWLERICGHEYANEVIPTTDETAKPKKTSKATKSTKTTKTATKKTTKAKAKPAAKTAAKSAAKSTAKAETKGKAKAETNTKSDSKANTDAKK
ncbi:MAG TPA: hypothetical protein GX717_08480 [Clostridiaceae bacterium]|nr:hypothetical protein [Clostridiaceae bacterium]